MVPTVFVANVKVPSWHLSDTKQTLPFGGPVHAIYRAFCVGAGHILLRMCKPPAEEVTRPPCFILLLLIIGVVRLLQCIVVRLLEEMKRTDVRHRHI